MKSGSWAIFCLGSWRVQLARLMASSPKFSNSIHSDDGVSVPFGFGKISEMMREWGGGRKVWVSSNWVIFCQGVLT